MNITKQILINAWNKYKTEISLGEWWDMVTPKVEDEFLYSIIRKIKPKKILEISPQYGRSTKIMLSAVRKNNKYCEILSYDVISDSSNLNTNDSAVKRELIVGDVKSTININDIIECDFLFMDSDHSYGFGKWYSQNIIPHLKNNILVYIHDWPTYASDGAGCNYLPHTSRGKFENQNLHGDGEPRAVKEYCVHTKMLNPIMNLDDENLNNIEYENQGIDPVQLLVKI